MKTRNPLKLKEVGLRIRLERENLNLSREEFARILNLSTFYIGQIERGDRNMSIDTLIKVSNTLNLSIDYILKGETIYIESIYCKEAIDSIDKDDISNEVRELLNLVSGLSRNKINLIKEMTKLIIPYLVKG